MSILKHLVPEASLNTVNTVGLKITTCQTPQRRRADPRGVRLGENWQASDPASHRLSIYEAVRGLILAAEM